jgi:sugar phosphate isomerase/epimerase
MQLGISSYTYTWATGVPGSLPAKPLSAFGLVDKAASEGLKLVQIADNLPLENWPADNLNDLFDYARNKEVSIEMASRGLTPGHAAKCLEAAEILHSPILRMVIDGPGYEPDIETVHLVIENLIPGLKTRKIQLAIENHDRFKALEFEKIIRKAGSEWVGICLDSVNSMGAGEGFETVSEILLPYTINLHLKDFSIRRVPHKMGLIIEGRPAGQGLLKIKEIIGQLSVLNRCRSAILELWTPPDPDIESTILKEEAWLMKA